MASEPEELPSVYVSAISSQSHDAAALRSPSIEPFITVPHYSEIKPTLLQVLEMYRGDIALPVEPFGVKHCAEHHRKLKPGSNPVYINAYKLPHSQRQLVEELIIEMLDQGVIQESNSPWNSFFIFGAQEGRYFTFTAAYHPVSNGLVERANIKILEVLRPIVNELLDNWEDWLPHAAASLNSSVSDSTGKSLHIIWGRKTSTL